MNADLTGVDSVVLDVNSSSAAVTFSVFFWDADFQQSVLSEPSIVSKTNAWQTITCKIKWPDGFDVADIDELKIVIAYIEDAGLGYAFVDNIRFQTTATTKRLVIDKNKVSWPRTSTSVLETATAISGPWTRYTGPLDSTATDYTVPNNTSDRTRFYRLRSQ